MKRIGTFIVIGATATNAFASATFVGLGDLPGGNNQSFAYAISRNGMWIVGQSAAAVGTTAYRWSLQNGMLSLGQLPGGSWSQASGINWNGSVIVGTGNGGGSHAYRWTAGTGMVALPDLAGGFVSSGAYGVSGDGNVVFGYGTGHNGQEMARWVNGQVFSLGNLDYTSNWAQGASCSSYDGSKIYGFSGIGNTSYATVWTSQTGLTPLYHQGSDRAIYGLGTTDDGETVVGWGVRGTGWVHAYVKTGNNVAWLPGLNANDSGAAHAVSPYGDYIGGESLPDGACVWDVVHGPRSLRSILEFHRANGFSGWDLKVITGITVVGDEVRVCGNGLNPQAQDEAFYATFPVTRQMLSGQCILQDFGNMAGQMILIQIREVGSIEPITTYFAFLDAVGRYSVETQMPIGEYDVSIKGSHWLRQTVGNVTFTGTSAGANCSLINGDVDGDNEVSIGDYGRLSAAFGTSLGDPMYDYEADLDGDGSVDIGDFAILSTNFGSVGND
jgi:probable HAF family extracellular repeat protein